MNLAERVHNLEEDVIQFKASQALGSSSTRIIPISNVSVSGNMKMEHYVVGIFKSTGTINPLVTPRLTVKINGSTPTEGSRNVYITYDDFYIHYLLMSAGKINTNLFDEYTTGFLLRLNHTAYGSTQPYSVSGTVYATCEGTLTIYDFDDPNI